MNLNNQLDRENIIKEYLIYIKDVKNYSPNTVKSYKSDINHYIKNSQKIGEFSDYLRQLNKNQYSKTSINRKITSINLFLSWAVENNYFNKNKIKKQIEEGCFVIKEKQWKAKYESIEDLFPENICNIFREFPNLIKKI